MPNKLARGTVIQRTYRNRAGKQRKSRTWSAVYYVNGKQVRVPAKTEDRSEAILFLRRKMAEVGTLENLGAMPERVTMNQLFDLLLAW